MIKQIQDLASKTYLINERINFVKKKYYQKIFLPNFIKSISLKFSISEHFDLNYAFNQTPVKGLFNSIFDTNIPYFNSLDLSVAINIAINGYCNQEYVHNESISDCANFLCEEFKRNIYNDKIISEYLKEINKDISEFNFKIEKHLISAVLSNKIEIFKTYFKRHENDNYNSSITIFHQSENSNWIDWKEENSITIYHNTKKFNEGFFLLGFDYVLSSGENLRIATSKDGWEYFNPTDYDWRKNVLWSA